LLRARKLDRTLTSAMPARPAADRVMPCHVPALDAALHGGVARGQLSEVVGPVSSGRTSLTWAWLGAATLRGEQVALIDTFDRFDPASGAACGIDLTRLLWVRGQPVSKTAGAVDPAWLPGVRAVTGPGTLLERTIDRALKALNLVLQSGVCTAVALDLADVPPASLRRIPPSTWLRVERIVEGSEMACLLMAPVPLARSAGGITIVTGAAGATGAAAATGAAGMSSAPSAALVKSALWAGESDRARRLDGLCVMARPVSPRRATASQIALEAKMDPSV
jgi:hypothetical protein